MNKEQLQKQAEKLQKELDKLKQQIEECDKEESDRCEEHEIYYYLDDDGEIKAENETSHFIDDCRYDLGNYFKTKEDAAQYRQNLKTKMKLKRLAKRLNKGVGIDWNNLAQCKHCFCLHSQSNRLEACHVAHCRDAGVIYCLDKDFLEIAKKEIGEQALMDYLKSGV